MRHKTIELIAFEMKYAICKIVKRKWTMLVYYCKNVEMRIFNNKQMAQKRIWSAKLCDRLTDSNWVWVVWNTNLYLIY